MHDLAQKRFSKGRSLSEMELRAIKRETTEPALPHMRHPNWADPIKNNRLILYAEPTLAEIRSLKQASDPYEDDCLTIRAMRTNLTRKRLEMLDWSLGISFSGHALGRLFERQGVSVNLIPHTFFATLESLNYIFTLLYFMDTTYMAIPFMGGLALGHAVGFADKSTQLLAYGASLEGCGFLDTADMFHVGRRGDVDYGLRITTFISFDMLRPDQERLRNTMISIFKDTEAITSLLESGLYQTMDDPDDMTDDMINLEANFTKLKESHDWLATCAGPRRSLDSARYSG